MVKASDYENAGEACNSLPLTPFAKQAAAQDAGSSRYGSGATQRELVGVSSGSERLGAGRYGSLQNTEEEQENVAKCSCGHQQVEHDSMTGECKVCDCQTNDPVGTCKRCGQKEREGMMVKGLCEECQGS